MSWQRAELANLALEKAEGEIDGMNAIAQKMRDQGLKIEFGNCGENKGRVRVCVAIEPGLKHWVNRAGAVCDSERLLSWVRKMLLLESNRLDVRPRYAAFLKCPLTRPAQRSGYLRNLGETASQ